MSSRILLLCGSPRRKGNTNRIVNWFEESAVGSGAAVERIDTTRLAYKTIGCLACMKCKESDRYECVVKDDARPLLARIPEFDVIVMATPVYWFAPSAQIKVFGDRMFSLVKIDSDGGTYNHPLKGKKLVALVTAGGDRDAGLTIVDDTYRTMADFLGMEYRSILVPLTPALPADLEKDEKLKEKVCDLGRSMAG